MPGKAKSEKIKVNFGELAKPLSVSTINAGTTLGEFLEAKELSFGSSVRVNGKVAKKGDVLKGGDIVTSIEDVSGGSR